MLRPLVFIDGDQGTTGLQVRQRLADRTDLNLLTLPEADRKRRDRRAEALNACDLALLCLPDDAAREAVGLIRRPGVRVIDASSAHRTDPQWVYGLPELSAGQGEAIARAPRVSNPGCYPTGMLLLVAPLVAAGLLPAQLPLTVHAISGYSGQGRAGLQAHEGPHGTSAPAVQVYGLSLQHKHIAEMQAHAGLHHPPMFVPAYGHYRQGIVLTIGLHRRQLPAHATPQALQAALAAHHAGHPAVSLAPLAGVAGLDPTTGVAPTLDPQAMNGSDRVRLAMFADRRDAHDGQILLTAVFDNLGKGAAGAAVQNLGLMLGLSDPDRTGVRAGPTHAASVG